MQHDSMRERPVAPFAIEPERLKGKSDLHLARKAWHAAGVGGMAVCFWKLDYGWSWAALAAIAAIALPIDFFRLSRPRINEAALRIMGPLMRKHEASSISGLTYLLGGAAILLAFFDRDVILLTLLFLALGDPIASLCGIRFGKDRIFGKKTLQGTIGAFVTCTAIAAIYFYSRNIMTERLWIVAPISGLIGAAAELIPIGKLDDNLTFPAIAATLLWILFALFA